MSEHRSAPLRVLVVDDEVLARRALGQLLENRPECQVVAECSSGEEVIAGLSEWQPDLMFLDIQMPGMDGFELLDNLDPADLPSVIFVTAYDQYAVRAFQANAVDYLLKPVDEKLFDQALGKVLDRRQQGPERHGGPESVLAEVRERRGPTERLVVKGAGRIVLVPVPDIRWIEAAGNYVQLHTAESTVLYRQALTHLEKRLDPHQFLRIHRSLIVNSEQIREIEPTAKGDFAVLLHDGTRLHGSRRQRHALQLLLDRWT